MHNTFKLIIHGDMYRTVCCIPHSDKQTDRQEAFSKLNFKNFHLKFCGKDTRTYVPLLHVLHSQYSGLFVLFFFILRHHCICYDQSRLYLVVSSFSKDEIEKGGAVETRLKRMSDNYKKQCKYGTVYCF